MTTSMASRLLTSGSITNISHALLQVQTARGTVYNKILAAGYAKKGAAGKTMGAPQKKKTLEVETDAEKLCSYLCGGNIHKEGSDPKLKPDSEYPDWLWNLNLARRPVDISELDPDSWEYWRRLRRITLTQKHFLMSKKR